MTGVVLLNHERQFFRLPRSSTLGFGGLSKVPLTPVFRELALGVRCRLSGQLLGHQAFFRLRATLLAWRDGARRETVDLGSLLRARLTALPRFREVARAFRFPCPTS